jgi:hypothetical protein
MKIAPCVTATTQTAAISPMTAAAATRANSFERNRARSARNIRAGGRLFEAVRSESACASSVMQTPAEFFRGA